jgi:L-threonylcarbamoyladenylate synthase
VAFPTETVYGLGAHALDEMAVHRIFKAKKRPLTDPLIVHVLTPEDAYTLWDVTAQDATVLSALCESFWPGPLTLVYKAASHVPDCLMAGTGHVACRSPSHETARALLQACRVPLAAPSANTFGHVSPTTAQHVMDDLCARNVWIVQDDSDNDHQASFCCNVGVESTVAKFSDNTLTILRQGAVSQQALAECLRAAGLDAVTVQSDVRRATAEHVPNVAPGQSIRHYSPNIASFLVSETCADTVDAGVLRTAVVIDFGAKLLAWKDVAMAYKDLSATGSSTQAAQVLFDTLRWAESIPGAKQVLFPDLAESDDALLLALKDRLTRAASGIVIDSLIEANDD